MLSNELLSGLLNSPEPVIRWRARLELDPAPLAGEERQTLQEAVWQSPHVQAMLNAPKAQTFNCYAKWDGAHWLLANLAEMNCPPPRLDILLPFREKELNWLFSKKHVKAIKTIDGRTRRCASQEGYAILALLRLGLADERVDELAGRLVRWQWPDGGWNCDRRPEACHSSFMESLIPLRALALHARLTGCADSKAAADRAAEFFLKHRLYQRIRDGSAVDDDFTLLFFPYYWRFGILPALKAMSEAGFITDERCQPALALLQSKCLPDGGFPAEKAYYRFTEAPVSGRSPVSWGGAARRRANPFITLEALSILKAAGLE